MKIKFEPPYYIVIFSFKKTKDLEGYAEKAILLNRLVKEVEGFLGVEDYFDYEGNEVSISYWRDLDAIQEWRTQINHVNAKGKAHARWYEHYNVKISKVEKEY